MSGYARCFRLLPLGGAAVRRACLSTDGYYRYQDGGPSGAAGCGPGTAGSAGTTGGGGTTGGAGTGGPVGAAGTTGTAGSLATGRGGTTGTAGGRGGTTGSAGRGGTTGAAGVSGTAGSAGVLFADDFETGMDGWNGQGPGTTSVIADGSQVMSLTDLAVASGDRDQRVVAAGNLAWTDVVIEARVKPLMYAGH